MSTITIHGLSRIFNGVNATYSTKNDQLFRSLEKDHVSGLRTGIFTDNDSCESWISKGVKDSLRFNKNSEKLFCASVYKADLKYAQGKGKACTIKSKPGVVLERFISYDAKNKILKVGMKDGKYILLSMSGAKKGIELYKAGQYMIDAFKQTDKDNLEFKIPLIDMEEVLDLQKLGVVGKTVAVTKPANHPGYLIASATQENMFQLSLTGVKAKSVTRVALLKTGKPTTPPKKKVVIVDKPFLVAIFNKGCDNPEFVAHCPVSVWKNPN